MKRAALILGVCFAVSTLHAQLDRASAFDTMKICRGLTCEWTLADEGVQLHNGPYAFGMDKDSDHLIIQRGSQRLAAVELKDLSGSITMTWAKDHHSFAVTWSDGGSIGGFHVRTFHLHDGFFHETAGATRAFQHFKKLHDCRTRGDNVQAYRFENDGKRLMLILSVYPTGDCGLELGHTEGYLIRVSDGAILKCIGIRELNSYMRQHPEGS